MTWFVSIDGGVTGPHEAGAIVDGIGKKWIPARAKISTDETNWSPVTSNEMFASAFRQAGLLAPAQQVVMQPIYVPSPYDDYPRPSGTSGMAIAGFVFAFFCSPIGLILSLIARGQIRDSGGRQGGEGLAVAGIAISIASFVIGVIAYAR